jgi:hypothetical protein
MYYSKFDSPLYMIMTVVNATDINRTNLPIKKRKWSARTLFVLGMLVLVSFAALAANEATANKTKVAKAGSENSYIYNLHAIESEGQ